MILARILACLIVMGGIVRIFATERLFVASGIGELWSGHAYSLYIYKVLGAFVILTGVLLWSVARKAGTTLNTVRAMRWGMVLVGCVMLGAGVWTGLAFRYYVVDVVFTWLVAVVLGKLERDLVAAVD